PQTINEIVPGALPSINTSCGCTTTASATTGFVTAIRVMAKSVDRTVDRPAVSVIRWTALVVAALGAGCCASRAARAPASAMVNASPNRRRHSDSPVVTLLHYLFGPLRGANRFDCVLGRRRRRRRLRRRDVHHRW